MNPILLPDFRQIARCKLSHLFALTNSNWEQTLLIRPGQAGLGKGRYSIMKVFTLVISQGCNILFYGLDCALRWEWDVFNVRAERILLVNALMSVMKLCNLKSKVDDKDTCSHTNTHTHTHTHTHTCKHKQISGEGIRFLRKDVLNAYLAPQLPMKRSCIYCDFSSVNFFSKTVMKYISQQPFSMTKMRMRWCYSTLTVNISPAGIIHCV